MSKLKSLIIDVIDDYSRGDSEFKLAEKYDLSVDDIINIIEQYYNILDEVV
jgi:uncharacterized protein (DUF433 family)